MGLTTRQRERITTETVACYVCDQCGREAGDIDAGQPCCIPDDWYVVIKGRASGVTFCSARCVAAYAALRAQEAIQDEGLI